MCVDNAAFGINGTASPSDRCCAGTSKARISNLPKLAMYMGHISIVSTAYYLRWIPQLAAAASHRLETHFGHLITGGAA